METRTTRLFACAVILGASAACSTAGGSREVPLGPSDSTSGGDSSVTFTTPVADSPTGDAALADVRPTLSIANATSTPAGTRTYEFQISDTSTFASAQLSTIAASSASVPEGPGGHTTFTPPSDLLPITRYYWRARASQAGAKSAWSATAQFRTPIANFKSGNQVYDTLTDGVSVGEIQDGAFFPLSDSAPGLKLNSANSYISYAISPLPEGEVSVKLIKVKPGDSSYDNQFNVITMSDGTGSFNSNPFRVAVKKKSPSDGGRVVLEFTSAGNAAVPQQTGGLAWDDTKLYMWKLEWRAGTARIRVWENDENGALKVDLSVGYLGTYSPTNHLINIGSRNGDSLRDIRARQVYISPFAKPLSLGKTLGLNR